MPVAELETQCSCAKEQREKKLGSKKAIERHDCSLSCIVLQYNSRRLQSIQGMTSGQSLVTEASEGTNEELAIA